MARQKCAILLILAFFLKYAECAYWRETVYVTTLSRYNNTSAQTRAHHTAGLEGDVQGRADRGPARAHSRSRICARVSAPSLRAESEKSRPLHPAVQRRETEKKRLL